MAAQLEVSRVKEELGLYKIQLDTAQKEIFRAQEILLAVEAQRDDAEAAAAKARTTARQINEEHMIHTAREEGRRLGFQEGLRRGRQTGYDQGREVGYTEGRSAPRNLASAQPEGDGDGDSENFHQNYDMPPTQSPVYPESIRIRTPSITGNMPHDASIDPRRSTTSVPFAPDTTSPGTTRTSSIRPQTHTETRPPSVPPDGRNHYDGNPNLPAISVQANTNTVPGTNAQIDGQVQRQSQSDSQSPNLRRSGTRPRRRSSPESLSSTTTGLSQLDLISFPNPSLTSGRAASTGRSAGGSGAGKERENVRGLSVIREDASSPARSVRSSTNINSHANASGNPSIVPFTDVGKPAPKRSSRELDGQNARSQYSHPEWVEEWRRAGSVENPARSSRANAPSMPPNSVDSTMHRHTHSVESRSERSGGRGRVASSSDSITIDVVPPSHSSSHTNHPHSPSLSQSFPGSNHLLSPNSAHINISLPSGSQPRPSHPHSVEVPTVPNSPAQSQTQLRFTSLERQSTPASGGTGAPFNATNGDAVPILPFGHANDVPSGPPVIPGNAAFARGQGSRSRSRNGVSREFYAVAPVPEGATYPDLRASSGSRGIDMAPPRPGTQYRHSPAPSTGTSIAQESARTELHRVPSNASISSSGSYTRFDRSTYLDPAYYAQERGRAQT